MTFNLDDIFLLDTIKDIEGSSDGGIKTAKEISDEEVKELIRTFIVPKLQEILNKIFGPNSPKSQIEPSEKRLNFACPFCGDSQTNPYKKRGNIFFKDLHFKCFNCGTPVMGLKKFMMEFLNLETNDIYNLSIVESNISRLRTFMEEYFEDQLCLSKFEPYFIDREDFKNKLKLVEAKGSSIENYLRKRNQTKFNHFLYNEYFKQIYILNLADDNHLISYIVRNLESVNIKKYGKYIIHTFQDLCDDMEIVFDLHNKVEKNIDLLDYKMDEEKTKESELDLLMKLSSIFNLYHIDFSKTVTIFEGNMDALLFPNSVAMMGANKSIPIMLENKRYFLDNDATGIKNSIQRLQAGDSIFLWTKFLEDHEYLLRKKKNIKDLTDILKADKNFKLQKLNNYFSDDKFDILSI